MTTLKALRNNKKELYIGEADKKQYHPLFVRIADQLLMTKTLNGKKYRKVRKKLHEKLFRNLKSDWVVLNKEDIEWHEHAFVKTKAFEKVSDQSACMLIGRKGSGKSTITKFLAHQFKFKYKDHAPIIVDKFQLEYIFSIFDEGKVVEDIKHVFTVSQSYSFAWELYIYLYCINVLIKEYLKGSINGERRELVVPLKNYIFKILKDEKFENFLESSASFVYCLNCLKRFINDCINNASNDQEFFASDVLASFSFDRFLTFSLGEEVLDSFEKIINTCTKKFLVSLDGFDQSFDEYRKRTIENFSDPKIIKDRTNNEIDWLTTFLNTVLRIKSNHQQKEFYKLIDFCATIPIDRFLEIRKKERDTYIYSGRYATLQWSGIELAILLRKRLELLSGYFCDDKTKSVEERLQDVLENGFKGLLTETITSIDGVDHTKHIFLDILRHTFWRPRDILWYFRNILAMLEELNRRNRKITNDIIKKIISDTTFRVIEAEFVAEFGKSLMNISEVLSKFNQSDNIVTYDQLKQKLYSVNFNFIYGQDADISLSKKIEYLYTIGFLGILADAKFINRFGLKLNHIFCFNEGSQMFRRQSLHESELEKLNYIIHPIFCEYLNLNVNKNILVLDYSWDYLNDNEAFTFTVE